MDNTKTLLTTAKQKVRVVKINKLTTWYIADCAPLDKQIWTTYNEAVQQNIKSLNPNSLNNQINNVIPDKTHFVTDSLF